ncbi:MAG: sulfatase-like hydrolase/transferase, partial [Rhodospirillaceae bacterium]|nr:sulfatase-like hydrolase/transferase [Rhodospirillaceae bacterium]
MAKKPNFLFIITDQHRADHLGCYGNPVLRTPSIDSLARRGLAFDEFYVSCPICMPNRATILTGRTPSASGVRQNGLPLSLDAVTFVDLLKAEGYSTGLIGKAHFQNISKQDASLEAPEPPSVKSAMAVPQPGIAPDRPRRTRGVGEEPIGRDDALWNATREWRTGPGYDLEWTGQWRVNPDYTVPTPYYGFDHVEIANGHGDWVGGDYAVWRARQDPDIASKVGPPNGLDKGGVTAPQAWRTAVPEELWSSTWVADRTIDWLERQAGGNEPFFLFCSFPDPHNPFCPPGKYWDMYDPAEIPLPPSQGHVNRGEPRYLRTLRAHAAEGRKHDDFMWGFLAGERHTREILALTYGLISCLDDQIGRILVRLRELGLDDDTVVVFTSDHGDFMGDHGLMLKQGLHYQGVIRVPFIWADPAGVTGRRSDVLGGSIDIAQTILNRAGVAAAAGMQGFDIAGAAATGKQPGRAGLMIEEDCPGLHIDMDFGLRTWTLIHDGWRLTRI